MRTPPPPPLGCSAASRGIAALSAPQNPSRYVLTAAGCRAIGPVMLVPAYMAASPVQSRVKECGSGLSSAPHSASEWMALGRWTQPKCPEFIRDFQSSRKFEESALLSGTPPPAFPWVLGSRTKLRPTQPTDAMQWSGAYRIQERDQCGTG